MPVPRTLYGAIIWQDIWYLWTITGIPAVLSLEKNSGLKKYLVHWIFILDIVHTGNIPPVKSINQTEKTQKGFGKFQFVSGKST